jgi:hypothetical protein
MKGNDMPGRKLADSIRFREWVQSAIDHECKTPMQVLTYIERVAKKGEAVPALPTVSRIMREIGYKPPDDEWEKP